jgi:hypothetical protein
MGGTEADRVARGWAKVRRRSKALAALPVVGAWGHQLGIIDLDYP